MLQLLTLIFVQKVNATSGKNTIFNLHFLLDCLHTWKEQVKSLQYPLINHLHLFLLGYLQTTHTHFMEVLILH